MFHSSCQPLLLYIFYVKTISQESLQNICLFTTYFTLLVMKTVLEMLHPTLSEWAHIPNSLTTARFREVPAAAHPVPGAAGSLSDSWFQWLAFEHLLTSLLGPDLVFPPTLLAEVSVTSCRRPNTLSLLKWDEQVLRGVLQIISYLIFKALNWGILPGRPFTVLSLYSQAYAGHLV